MTSDPHASRDFGPAELGYLVRVLYRAFLSREPDAGEVALHTAGLQSGSPLATVYGIIQSEEAASVEGRRDGLDRWALTASRESDGAIGDVIRTLYGFALRREPSNEEIDHWCGVANGNGRLSDIVLGINDSDEARLIRQPSHSGLPPGVLVQMAFEIVLGRGASAHEVDATRTRIENGALSLPQLVMEFFDAAVSQRLVAGPVMNNPDVISLFGSRGHVSRSDWNTIAAFISPHDSVQTVFGRGSVVTMNEKSGCVVSIITSLYRGGDFIGPFLENITSQTIFQSHCELIIIDAASPDGEQVTIEKYRKRYNNIMYRRVDRCIGIYEAWNIGVAMARGKYLTNANLDDLRRSDSLEIQAAILDTMNFVDVTYQDVFYSFEPGLSFDQIAAHNLRTGLPIVSQYNLMEFNSPHNAPMWRKSLHDEVGLFDENLRSAADFDFWIRCRIAGKVFYKVNDPHVAYYVNPRGVSTRPDTPGMAEANAISRKYYRKLVSPMLTVPHNAFLREVDSIATVPRRSGHRYDIVQSALCELGSTIAAPDGGVLK